MSTLQTTTSAFWGCRFIPTRPLYHFVTIIFSAPLLPPTPSPLAFSQDLTWRAVDCPTAALNIQFAFASITNTKFFFSVHLWDMMVPAVKVEVRARCEDGTFFWKQLNFSSNGFFYQGRLVGYAKV